MGECYEAIPFWGNACCCDKPQTIYDILLQKSSASGPNSTSMFLDLIKNVFVPQQWEDQFLPGVNFTGWGYPINNFLVIKYWLESIVAFVPTNEALEEFSPFGDILRDKVLSREWTDHALAVAACSIVPGYPGAKTLEEMGSELQRTFWGTFTVDAGAMSVETQVDGNDVKIIEPNLPGFQYFPYNSIFDILKDAEPQPKWRAFLNIVDGVVMPDDFRYNVVEYLRNDPKERFTVLLDLIEKLGLDDYLEGYGKDDMGFTFFAPVDSAFQYGLPHPSPDGLKSILLNHIVEGQPVYPKTTKNAGRLRTSMAGNHIFVGELIKEGACTWVDDDALNCTSIGQTAEFATFPADGSPIAKTARLAKSSNSDPGGMGDIINKDYARMVSNGLVFVIEDILAFEPSYCKDSESRFRLEKNEKQKSCQWVQKRNTMKRCKKEPVSFFCPKTCGRCG